MAVVKRDVSFFYGPGEKGVCWIMRLLRAYKKTRHRNDDKARDRVQEVYGEYVRARDSAYKYAYPYESDECECEMCVKFKERNGATPQQVHGLAFAVESLMDARLFTWGMVNVHRKFERKSVLSKWIEFG